MTLSSSSLMRNVPQEDGDVTRVTPVEKRSYYEEVDGQRSFARGQELVQSCASLSNEKKSGVIEEKMVSLQRDL